MINKKPHPDLHCFVSALCYSFEHQTGLIWNRGYCDMTGCTKLFERIAPEVQSIQTIVPPFQHDPTKHHSGPWFWDTIYRRESNGEWEAFSVKEETHKAPGPPMPTETWIT